MKREMFKLTNDVVEYNELIEVLKYIIRLKIREHYKIHQAPDLTITMQINNLF